MAKPTCWVELRYGWGLKGMSIAQTASPELLQQVKATLLEEGQRRAQVTSRVDRVLGFVEQQELHKLQRVLEVLIPKHEEPEG